jgi:hypothetical protein
MNKKDAKLVAETITVEQLAAMFERAKTSIVDWKKPSHVNPSISLGAAWNIFYPWFLKSKRHWHPNVTNAVWVFGDYLDDDLKPDKKSNHRKPAVDVFHQEPIFEVLP